MFLGCLLTFANIRCSNQYDDKNINTCQVFAHSVFDLQLALGLSIEAGIVDDSLSLKLAGKGIKTGRKVEICSLDVCFGVDFGRIFG